MTEQFKWVDYYEEFASKLLEYRNNRKELIDKIVKVYDSIEMKLPKLEANGIPEDIGPFTVFGLFNKGITTSGILIKNADIRKKIMNVINSEEESVLYCT